MAISQVGRQLMFTVSADRKSREETRDVARYPGCQASKGWLCAASRDSRVGVETERSQLVAPSRGQARQAPTVTIDVTITSPTLNTGVAF